MKTSLRLAGFLLSVFTVVFLSLRFVPKDSEVRKRPIEQPQNWKQTEDLKIIDWRLLRGLNYETGKTSSSLQSFHQKEVAISGFMVPLDDYNDRVTEFLLVPSPQACIHVPPPPPNQMIYVKMKDKQEVKASYAAIWVEGILDITKVESPYGAVSFQMSASGIKPYTFDRGLAYD